MFRSVASARRRRVRLHSARGPVALATVGAAAAGLATASCRDVTAPLEDPRTTTYAPGLNIRLSDFTLDTSGVYYQDVPAGSGARAVDGSTITYRYTGNLTNGREFGSNVSSNLPITYTLGSGGAIRGFDRGLLGVTALSRRRLIIPPALGYGNKTNGTGIPAGSVLVFTIDVTSVTPPAATTTTTTNRAPG